MSDAERRGRSRGWTFAKDILLVALVLIVATGLALAMTLMSRQAAPAAFDFSLEARAPSGSMAPGDSVMTTVTATATSGSTRQVQFSCAGLPEGASCSFTPPSCSPTCSADLVLSTSPGTPQGTHDVTVVASNGTISRTTTVQVNLSASPPPPPFDFSLGVDPASGVVVSGGSVSANVTATLVAGSTRAVHFSCSNLPPGTTCRFAPPSCGPTCNATLSLQTSADTTAGIYLINVTGSHGSLSRTVPYALTVQEAPVRTLTFQAGGGPFSKTDDATIDNGTPNVNYGADDLVVVDGYCVANVTICRGLLAFLSVIGPNEGQVPLNSTIVSAAVELNVTNSGVSLRMDQVQEAWAEETVTWNSFANPGTPNTKGPTTFFKATVGRLVLDITHFMRNWAKGEPNYGVFFRTDSWDGMRFDASESGRIPPKLTVTFRDPPPPPPAPSFDFSLAVDPAEGSVVSGRNVSAQVTATLVSGSTHAIQFSCSNLPPGTTCTFLPPSCSPTCSATLRLATSANTAAGTYSISAIASDGSLSRTIPFALTVQGEARVGTLAFQEGDGGPFSETYDATIHNSNPDGNYGADPLLMVDGGTCIEVGTICRVLLSFPHAIGPNEGQIPVNSTIVSASLVLNVENHGPSQRIDQVQEAWTEATVTWNAFATPGAPRTRGPTNSFDTTWGAFVVNITAIVQSWVSGDPNHGAFLQTDSVNGTDYHSSESGRPPKLTVTFRAMVPPMAASGSLFSPDAPYASPIPSAANGGFEVVGDIALKGAAIPASRQSCG